MFGTLVIVVALVAPQIEAGTHFRQDALRDQVRAGFWPVTVEERIPTSFQAPERSKARRVMWALIGGAGGFFGGGYLGAALEPDCSCDDPGLQGWLIGAPVGAATGAILGWVFGR